MRQYPPLTIKERENLCKGNTKVALNMILELRGGSLIEEAIDFVRSHKGFETWEYAYQPATLPRETPKQDAQLTLFPLDSPTVARRVYHACPLCRSYLSHGQYWKEALADHIVRQHPGDFWTTRAEKVREVYLPEPRPLLVGIVVQDATELPPDLTPLPHIPPKNIPLQAPKVLSQRDLADPDVVDRAKLRIEFEIS